MRIPVLSARFGQRRGGAAGRAARGQPRWPAERGGRRAELHKMAAAGAEAAAEEEKRLPEGDPESGGDSDDEGDSDSSGDGEDEEKENEAEIQRLEEQLSINAFDYNCHLDLIKLLRQEGELVKLRRARQKMSELFPLTEEIWLDWLKDEIKMASEISEREKVYELFERAVKDYICPEIWLEYAQYSIGGIGQEGGIEKVRSIFERALTAVGLHVTKGTALWEAYREFENAILETAQLEKIHTLFRRQLGIPLLDMEASYAEYEEWSEEPIPETTIKNYKKALQQLEKCKPYEEALLGAETPKLAEYQAYIDFEMKAGDPARIQLIYERALAENCLVPDLWARYNQYLDRQLKVKELVLSAHDRAVRNCPWTVGLWIRYLLAMERHRVEHSSISEMFEKALNAGFIQATDYVEIWQAYLDYLRRRVDFTQDSSKELEELRSAFARAVEYLKQEVEERFSESGDPSCTIMQNWARVEQLCCGFQKCCSSWGRKRNVCMAGILCGLCPQCPVPSCRAHGDTQHCRKALHRAVQCTSDYPEHVCEVLLTLERIEGTLEDWDAAVQKTENRLARVNEQRAKAAEKEAALAKQEEERAEQRKQARAEKKASKKAKKTRIGDKRKADEDDEGEWGQEEELPSKRYRGEGDGVLPEEDMEVETGLFGRSEKPDGPAIPKEKASTSRKDIPKVFHDSSKDKVTVFVSNLSYTMAEPEAKLRELFGSCGEVVEIRAVFNNKGTFRGYCYVQFREEEAARQALALDRTAVEGRPMFVSPCVDKNKNPDFKVFRYSTTLEKHKLFISGLPFSCTKEELEEVCKAHGNVKDIRLVTNRAGKPKGLAYVEYENEAQASQAVLKMDGLTVKDHVIKVMISNPPLRKLPDRPEPGRASLALAPRQIYGARGKGRTQLSMMPRALQRQSNPVAKAENGMVQNSPAASSDPPAEPKKMSNADFAKMLLKK
uniref:Spliceosome associated factor 3, U4/U6 recycling protein n=1 Tax=Cyanoderma ruficeps TaxID=181631 RepID=A0A8C3QFD5_9PASS